MYDTLIATMYEVCPCLESCQGAVLVMIFGSSIQV